MALAEAKARNWRRETPLRSKSVHVGVDYSPVLKIRELSRVQFLAHGLLLDSNLLFSAPPCA